MAAVPAGSAGRRVESPTHLPSMAAFAHSRTGSDSVGAAAVRTSTTNNHEPTTKQWSEPESFPTASRLSRCRRGRGRSLRRRRPPRGGVVTTLRYCTRRSTQPEGNQHQVCASRIVVLACRTAFPGSERSELTSPLARLTRGADDLITSHANSPEDAFAGLRHCSVCVGTSTCVPSSSTEVMRVVR